MPRAIDRSTRRWLSTLDPRLSTHSMRIAYITAGAAGMYCGSCLHDNTLAAALLELGEDVAARAHLHAAAHRRGGRQHRPRVLRRHQRLLAAEVGRSSATRRGGSTGCSITLPCSNALSRRAGSVDPTQLGDMTVSMLRGEAGNQRKELEKLVHWLLTEVKPDVVHLSNSMQIGMARMLRERSGPPVVCQLSGEDMFLEKLPPPHYDEARALLARAGGRRRRVRRAQPLLRRLHGRLPGGRSRASPRHSARPQARRPRHAAIDEAAATSRASSATSRAFAKTKACTCWSKRASNWPTRPTCRRSSLHAAGYLGEGDKPYLAAHRSAS